MGVVYLLEEKIPGYVFGICEPGLRNIRSDRVYDGSCLLWCEQMSDTARHYELSDKYKEVLIKQLILVQQEKDPLVLEW